MKAYVCSIGEKTTELCCDQLKRYGFEVILLDKKESWPDKYKRFIDMANEDCLRIDADVVVNKNIIEKVDYVNKCFYLMAQFTNYDFYKNDISIGNPVYYSKKAIKIIKNNLNKIDWRRPEASAWRLPDINDNTITIESVITGIHGFAQDKETMMRAWQNKKDRGQADIYDFDLAFKIKELYECRL